MSYAPVLPGFYEPQTQPFSGSTPETRETSRQAAQTVRNPDADRERIYQALVNVWPGGYTDQELQDKLAMAGDTQRPRRGELQKAGRIKPQGTRTTKAGKAATVWTLA